jgi:hypothetical protein
VAVAPGTGRGSGGIARSIAGGAPARVTFVEYLSFAKFIAEYRANHEVAIHGGRSSLDWRSRDQQNFVALQLVTL